MSTLSPEATIQFESSSRQDHAEAPRRGKRFAVANFDSSNLQSHFARILYRHNSSFIRDLRIFLQGSADPHRRRPRKSEFVYTKQRNYAVICWHSLLGLRQKAYLWWSSQLRYTYNWYNTLYYVCILDRHLTKSYVWCSIGEISTEYYCCYYYSPFPFSIARICSIPTIVHRYIQTRHYIHIVGSWLSFWRIHHA